MITTLKLRAYGKINLALDVLRKREDGYHDVRMIMQTVGIYDQVDLRRKEEPGITVETNLSYLPVNENNLVYQAARLLMEEFQVKEGLHIQLKKFLPVAAGMAGGSSDAAAVLYGVNKMFGLGLSKEALMERSGGTRGRMPAKKTADFARRGSVNLLIDIQKKMEAGKGKGYERWAKIFNLKGAAKTLNFLVDNGLTDYDGLLERAEEIRVKFEETSARMKQLEGRMAQTAQMKTHIINYSKTREVYAAYKKARNKGKFRAEHRAEIEKHEAAKRAFDALGGKAIPKVAQLTEEYGRLLEEKQDRYEEYRALKKEMLEYQTIRQNVDRILEMPEPEKMRDKEQQTR